MKVIKYESSVFCDVDDTILLWINPTINEPGKLAVPFADKIVYLTPHQYHVDLLKMYKKRGYHVTVWSANGWEHAETACKVLGLTDVVDHARGKPSKYMDDNTNPANILGPRVFEKDLTMPMVISPFSSYIPLTEEQFKSGGITITNGPYMGPPLGNGIVFTEDTRGILNGR